MMNSALKIVCCALTTVSVLGVIAQSSIAFRSADLSITKQNRVATFVPDPTAPPVITQGSGTR
jgi:hypothetical protein